MWCDGSDLETWEENHEDVSQYLHGICDEFVTENYLLGDICIAITEWRDDIQKYGLMHACLFRNGKYVDIRGDTEKFSDVLDGFDYGEFSVEKYETLETFEKRIHWLFFEQKNRECK